MVVIPTRVAVAAEQEVAEQVPDSNDPTQVFHITEPVGSLTKDAVTIAVEETSLVAVGIARELA